MRERQEGATGASRVAAAPVKGGPIGGAQHRRGLIVATIAGFLMTFFGAFGTGDLPLGTRLLYWLVVMESGALIGIGASTGVRSWGRLAARPVAEGALITLLIALPLTMVVAGASFAIAGLARPSAGAMLGMFIAVLVVTAAITAVNFATGRREAVPAPDADAPVAEAFTPMIAPAPLAPSPRPKLLDRLPAHLRLAEIHAVQSEDHYLRVHTSAGSDLILLRLGDAIAELDGLDGAQTHRSWWVARDAVRTVERSDGRALLTLPGGVVAPVSRSFLRPLLERNWFV